MQKDKTNSEVVVASVGSVFPSRSGNRRIVVRFKGGLEPWHAYMKPNGEQHHPEYHIKKAKAGRPVVLNQSEFEWCFGKWSQDANLGVKRECFIEGPIFEQAKALYFKVKAEEEYKAKQAEKAALQEQKRRMIASATKPTPPIATKKGDGKKKEKLGFFEGLNALRERFMPSV